MCARRGQRVAPRAQAGSVLALLAACLLTLTVVGAPARAVESPGSPRVDRLLEDPRITESSGLVVSRNLRGVVWTHNDSGDAPRLYAVGADGRTKATYRVADVIARDWEALAPGEDEAGRPLLWIGDIGDNAKNRSGGLVIHRVHEPTRLSNDTLSATSYRLVYPDGLHNAEALLVQPRTGQVFIVTKAVTGAGIYAAPRDLDPQGVNRLTRVAPAPPTITDGAFLADGRFVLRNTAQGYVYDRLGKAPKPLALPAQSEGETLAAVPGSDDILVGEEKAERVIWRLPVDAGPPPAAAAVTTPPPPRLDPVAAPAVTDQQIEADFSRRRALLGGALALAGVVAAILLLLSHTTSARSARRRRRRERSTTTGAPTPPAGQEHLVDR